MTFKKLNKFEAFLLNLKNKKAYNEYKYLKQLMETPNVPLLENLGENIINFKHSGHLGDIIYAIPTMYSLANGKKISLHLNINQDIILNEKHPLGSVSLNEKSILILKPLLSIQPQFNVIEIYNSSQAIDYDLDLFRKFPLGFDKGSISRWYFNIFATTYDLGKPWLKVAPETSMRDKIVIARSTRYNAPQIDYSFLQNYGNLVFVGLQEEYELIKLMIPQIEYIKTPDFLSLASIIAGCKLFIGNQSSPFALAEALKVPRILESYYLCPNVIPEGPNAYEFSFQPQFEHLVKSLI